MKVLNEFEPRDLGSYITELVRPALFSFHPC
jgi:hypothetical protein